jgi:hypothetical protein
MPHKLPDAVGPLAARVDFRGKAANERKDSPIMRTARRTLLSLLPLALAATTPALAVVVPGGGPARSDCYVGFDVQASQALTVSRTRVDQRACGGSCTFRVKACSGVQVSGCTAPPLSGPPTSNAGLAAPPLDTAGCGDAREITVRQKRKKKVTLAARVNAKPKKDKDAVLLRCLPNPGDAGCGGGGGVCTPPGGSRVFSIAAAGSHLFSGALPGDLAISGSGTGSFVLAMGTPGPDGVASLSVACDSILGFQVLDGSYICLKLEAAGSSGKIDCDGGTPVDVVVTGNSNGAGANTPATVQVEQGAPGRPGDAYITGNARALNCPSDGAAGGCLGTMTSAADCADPTKVDFSKALIVTSGASTTGTAISRIINPKPGSLGGGMEVSRTGEPFDCSNFVEDGPGILETPTAVYDNVVAGDITAVIQADD